MIINFRGEKKNQTNNERKMNGPSNHMVQSSGSRRFRKLNAKNYSIHLRNWNHHINENEFLAGSIFIWPFVNRTASKNEKKNDHLNGLCIAGSYIPSMEPI